MTVVLAIDQPLLGSIPASRLTSSPQSTAQVACPHRSGATAAGLVHCDTSQHASAVHILGAGTNPDQEKDNHEKGRYCRFRG